MLLCFSECMTFCLHEMCRNKTTYLWMSLLQLPVFARPRHSSHLCNWIFECFSIDSYTNFAPGTSDSRKTMDWNALEAAISAECLSEWLHRLFLEYDNDYSFCLLRPINNLSVIKGRVLLGWTSTKVGLMFLLKDTTQWRRWGSNPRPFGLESSTLPLLWLFVT